jgi:membrane dipeptidase
MMIIDMHTHAGRPSRSGPVDRAVLATMRPGGVAAAVVSAIADLPLIRRNKQTRRLEQAGDPVPGQCWAHTDSHLAVYEQAGMRIAREPEDIRAEDPALVLAVEGCDFLDGDLDRLDALAARGVRSIQLTHYLVNETGDIQTAPEVHCGLTRIGADAVRRMNAVGVMVDVTHCSEATVAGVVAATSRPVLCTHSNLTEPGHPDGEHPRSISRDYARMVAGTGGVIGVSIATLEHERFDGMVRQALRLIDAVGIDHVGIGSDLPSNVAAKEMPDFSRHREFAEKLRRHGLAEDEVAKVCAGNWLRVFAAARDAVRPVT